MALVCFPGDASPVCQGGHSIRSIPFKFAIFLDLFVGASLLPTVLPTFLGNDLVRNRQDESSEKAHR